MIIHIFCFILLIICGLAHGINLSRNLHVVKKQKLLFGGLSLIASVLLILTCSLLFDVVGHLINPDVCILGIVNCLITLLFYLTASHAFVYVAGVRTKEVFSRRLLILMHKTPWLFYPAIAVLFILSLKFIINNEVFQQYTNDTDIGLNHLQMVSCYSAGAISGFLVGAIASKIKLQQSYLLSTKNMVKWSIFLLVFVALGYQLINFVSFNFIINQQIILTFASGLTILLIGFHLLYLTVKSYS